MIVTGYCFRVGGRVIINAPDEAGAKKAMREKILELEKQGVFLTALFEKTVEVKKDD